LDTKTQAQEEHYIKMKTRIGGGAPQAKQIPKVSSEPPEPGERRGQFLSHIP
jgi:hypothetical protein